MTKPTDEEIELEVAAAYVRIMGTFSEELTKGVIRGEINWAIARMEEHCLAFNRKLVLAHNEILWKVEEYKKDIASLMYPTKLTPAQKAAIRWPDKGETQGWQQYTRVIKHALRDLLGEE